MKSMVYILLAMSFGIQAQAASTVLAAENIKCGGYMTLEKTEESLAVLRIEIYPRNECGDGNSILSIKSQDIKVELPTGDSIVELNPHIIGNILPISIGAQMITLNLSPEAQQILKSSYTRQDLVAMAKAKRDAEIAQRQRDEQYRRDRATSNAAATAGVGAAIVGATVVGGAAAAASTER